MKDPATLLRFCGECRKMRAGSTMHECVGETGSALVTPDTDATGCPDFEPGRARYFVNEFGLIEKKK